MLRSLLGRHQQQAQSSSGSTKNGHAFYKFHHSNELQLALEVLNRRVRSCQGYLHRLKLILGLLQISI